MIVLRGRLSYSTVCCAVCCFLTIAAAIAPTRAAAAPAPVAWHFTSALPVQDGERAAILAHVNDADVQRGLRYDRGREVAQSYARACEWYARAAARGVPAGEWALGDMYWNGEGVRRDYSQAAHWLAAAAESGFARAAAELGSAYYFGRGVALDKARAAQLFAGAASRNDALGDYWVAVRYARGLSTPIDYARAAAYMRAAANQHQPWAQEYLGSLYEQGHGVTRDHAQALRWYTASAAHGFPTAMADIARLYETGEGVAVDANAARAWYARAFEAFRRAALASDPFSQGELGWMYQRGLGTTRNAAAALHWLRAAAADNDPTAQSVLVSDYILGDLVTQNTAEALRRSHSLAAQGEAYGEYLTAECLEICPGAPDFTGALQWYMRAASDHYYPALVALGYMYQTGEGTPRNYRKAIEAYQRAFAFGDAEAAEDIGTMYYAGEQKPDSDRYTIRADNRKALTWYLRAADLGNANAMDYIGTIYENGYGVTSDAAKSIGWYKKAANAGSNWGRYDLALAYAAGTGGVQQDDSKALALFTQAADGGYADAQNQVGDAYDRQAQTRAQNDVQTSQLYAVAAHWYGLAAEAGQPSAELELARLYSTGAGGVPLDYVVATKWVVLAVANGAAHYSFSAAAGSRSSDGLPVQTDSSNARAVGTAAALPQTTNVAGGRFNTARKGDAARALREALLWRLRPEQESDANRLVRQWARAHGYLMFARGGATTIESLVGEQRPVQGGASAATGESLLPPK